MNAANHILFSIATAAQVCECSEGLLEKEIRAGRLQAKKLGRLTRIERTELIRWASTLPTKNVGTSADQGDTPDISVINQVVENTLGGLR